MNDALVLRQKSSEEGPDDPDNVLVLRQKPSEDRMIRMILNDVVFLIIGIRCLQKLSSSEDGEDIRSVSSRVILVLPTISPARPSPRTPRNMEERWIHISDRFAVKYDRYGRKKHGSSASSTPALRATTTKKNE